MKVRGWKKNCYNLSLSHSITKKFQWYFKLLIRSTRSLQKFKNHLIYSNPNACKKPILKKLIFYLHCFTFWHSKIFSLNSKPRFGITSGVTLQEYPIMCIIFCTFSSLLKLISSIDTVYKSSSKSIRNILLIVGKFQCDNFQIFYIRQVQLNSDLESCF